MAKRILALLLVALMTFALAACDNTGTSSATVSDQNVIADVQSDANANANKDTTSEKEDGKTESKEDGTTLTTSGVQSQAGSKQQGTTSKGSTSKQGGNNITASQDKVVSNANDNKDVSVKDDGQNIKPFRQVNVKKGASISQGLNLKGKTITMAITAEGNYHTGSFARTIAAFEKEYNCKVELKQLDFSDYNSQIYKAKSAGNSYDICYIHGSQFPGCAVDALYEPLNDTLRSGDVATTSTSGGVDLNKTSYFIFKDKIWGTCNFTSVFPYVIYYNKKMFEEAGLNDPRALAKAGKWNWSVIETYGRRVTDSSEGVYFLSNSFTYGRPVMLAYGAPWVVSDGKGGYKENLSSEDCIAGLKYIQKLALGSKAIAEPFDNAHPTNQSDTLRSGKAYMFVEETSKYLDLSTQVKKSTAFGRKKENIGLVEVPLAGNNIKGGRYPTGWLTAVACGAGKDPRVAVAWEVFRSKYVDRIQDSNAMSEEDKKYTNSFLLNDIVCEPAQFANSEGKTSLFICDSKMVPDVYKGADVAKSVFDYKSQLTDMIKFTLKQKA